MTWWGSGGDAVEVRMDVDELNLRLERLGANSRTLPMDAFAALVVGAVDDLIQSEGTEGTDGEWEPFSPETLKRHPRRVGGKLLQDTGALANIQVKDVGDQTLIIASPTAYTRHHIDGSAHMPKRDIFALHFDDLLEELAQLALQEVDR